MIVSALQSAIADLEQQQQQQQQQQQLAVDAAVVDLQKRLSASQVRDV